MSMFEDEAQGSRGELSLVNEELFERSLALAKKGLNFVSRIRKIGPITVSTEHGDVFRDHDTHHMTIVEDNFYFKLAVDHYDSLTIDIEDLDYYGGDDEEDANFWNGVNTDLLVERFGLDEVSNSRGLAFIDFLEALERSLADVDEPSEEDYEELSELLFKAATADSPDQDKPDPVHQDTVDKIKEVLEQLTLKSAPTTSSFIQGLLTKGEQTGQPRTLEITVPITDDEVRFKVEYTHYPDRKHKALRLVGLTSGELLFIEDTEDFMTRLELEKEARRGSKPGNVSEYFLRRGYRAATERDVHKIFEILDEAERDGIQFAEEGNLSL